MKAKPADTAFSKCVREAANWCCERCNTQYERRTRAALFAYLFTAA